MKKFFKLKRSKSAKMNTFTARGRLSRSMPGEAAALASIRYGGMSV